MRTRTASDLVGTYVFTPELQIAAVGTAFTASAYRGTGYARAVSGADMHRLIEAGVETVVLNVEMSNCAAIDRYRSLGFMPYCAFE